MRRLLVWVVPVLLCAPAASAQTVLTDLAGRGGSGGCITIEAPPGGSTFFVDPVNRPAGVAVDQNGKLFVATGSNCIYRLDADGLLRVGFIDSAPFKVGTGVAGFSDASPTFDASLALISNPLNLAVDSAGNLYIADASNQRVRKVNTLTWTISTIAGGGSQRPFDGIRATDASFLFPTGVGVDLAGNVYVADSNAGKVFKVDTNGIMTKIAGSGGFTYNGEGGPAITAGMIPMDVKVDAAGDVFIADWSNSIVRKVTPDGTITTVAGNPFNVTGLGDGGPAAFGGILNKPRGLALNAAGEIFIADTNDHRIRMVDTAGIIHTVAGDGTPGFSDTQLNFPSAVAVDNLGNVFIADTVNNQLRGVIVSQRTYRLTLGNSGAGTGTVSGAGSYIVGQFVPVAATAGSLSTFTGWSGPNAVECASGLVLMDAGKSCTANFDTAADHTPPVLSGVSGPITVNATSALGAVATFPLPTASDPDDAAGPVTCAPPSGSTFPLGTTTVTCSSTDTHSNTGSASFTVTVVPVNTVVTIIVNETIGVNDAVTAGTAVQVMVQEAISVVDTPTIAIPDTTPPVLTLPSGVTVDATSPAGAVVTFTASANDLVSGPAVVTCVPASGSTFAIGTTPVACSASDASGNVATGSFGVTVLGPQDMLASLATEAAGDFKQATNLLQNTLRSVSGGNASAACGQLGAFIDQVRGQSGKKLTPDEANQLLQLALDVKGAIGCPQ